MTMNKHLTLAKVLIKWNSSTLVGDMWILTACLNYVKLCMCRTAMGYYPYNLNKAPKYKDMCIRKMSIMAILVEEKKLEI